MIYLFRMEDHNDLFVQNGSARKSVTFVFDRVYNASTTTAQIYNEIPYSLVQSFLEG